MGRPGVGSSRSPAVGLRTAVFTGGGISPQEKSSGIALLLTVLWPGAGHLYLGLTQKAMPYFVANAIGVVFGCCSSTCSDRDPDLASDPLHDDWQCHPETNR